RRSQQYSTVVLKCESDRRLVGAIVAPAVPQFQISSCRATVSLNLPATTDPLFLGEITAGTHADHLVWRYEGDTAGYLILDISVLLKQGPVTVDALLFHRAGDGPSQQLQLYGVLPVRSEEKGDLTYPEISVGKAKVDAMSLC